MARWRRRWLGRAWPDREPDLPSPVNAHTHTVASDLGSRRIRGEPDMVRYTLAVAMVAALMMGSGLAQTAGGLGGGGSAGGAPAGAASAGVGAGEAAGGAASGVAGTGVGGQGAYGTGAYGMSANGTSAGLTSLSGAPGVAAPATGAPAVTTPQSPGPATRASGSSQSVMIPGSPANGSMNDNGNGTSTLTVPGQTAHIVPAPR